MRQLVKHGATALSGLALALFLSASPVRADMEVLESTVPDLKAGATLKDDAKLKLPGGATVRVLLKATGSTKTLKGPYEGTVAAYKEDKGWWDRMTGHNKDPEPPMGAMRSLKKPE